MNIPKLSIGISFKNPGSYFKLALQSIFAQTFTNWELILIDDGSTDDSLTIAKSIQDPRVRVYSDGESKGLNIRLNQIVQLANAPYFFRMDADDIMHPQRLEKQYQALLQHDDNTVIGTAAYSIDANSRVVGFRASRQIQETGFDARHSFFHPTVAASTAWFRRNPYSENFIYQRSQDAELWCRTTSNTKFINLPEPLLYYREDGVFSFNNYIGTTLGLLDIIHNNLNLRRSRYLYLFSRELIKLWIAFIYNCFGLTKYLVAMRYKQLTQKELQAADEMLTMIQQ
ncbi:MAG: glycosyltransferase family 2 protein [Cyanomargarita calcarea GSE-NOS-MK-12-04C]|jgi:glycosyltransferase involved in cell wall biosynthesis|uniref:Glycosyltransferase family 2 protein n=1 Tax=Cyanomargarita calcarea GSE-NOS-MK-12-04C TaxID=2839659 RepID=A0A951UQG2_9CYAN|nr:glycosyltransferase family 2 protein [Cyanomargarita calcarea GSE-NOS-MK-12-04C]